MKPKPVLLTSEAYILLQESFRQWLELLGYSALSVPGLTGTIRDFLLHFERTAEVCRMIYWSPFWVPETNKLNYISIQEYGRQYKDLLILIRDSDLNNLKVSPASLLNSLVT